MYKIDKEKLSTENKEAWLQVLDHISGIYRLDDTAMASDELFTKYCEAEMDWYAGYYTEVMQKYNPGVQIEITETEAAKPETSVEDTKAIQDRLQAAQIGETVTFGVYEQDNNLSNGAEPIEWIVLDKTEAQMLLLSKYCLQSMEYASKKKSVQLNDACDSWKESGLRKWLSTDFLDSAFDEGEKQLICMSEIKIEETVVLPAFRNKFIGKLGDALSEDKLFLLSLEETEKYLTTEEDRMLTATPYALETTTLKEDADNGCVIWWLRTKFNTRRAMAVRASGEIVEPGFDIMTGAMEIRPAMWVNIAQSEE